MGKTQLMARLSTAQLCFKRLLFKMFTLYHDSLEPARLDDENMIDLCYYYFFKIQAIVSSQVIVCDVFRRSVASESPTMQQREQIISYNASLTPALQKNNMPSLFLSI